MKPNTLNEEVMENNIKLMEIINRHPEVVKYNIEIIWLYFDPQEGAHNYLAKVTKRMPRNTKVMEFNFCTGVGWNVAFEWTDKQKLDYAQFHGINPQHSINDTMSEFMRKISNDHKLIVRPLPLTVMESLMADYGVVSSGITLNEFHQEFGLGDETKDTITYAKMCDNFAKLIQLFSEYQLQEIQSFLEDIEY